MSQLPRRVAAAATALLTIAMVTVLVLRATGAELAMGPPPSLTATVTPSPAPVTPSPAPVTPSPAPASAIPSRPPAEVFAAIEGQVSALRELPPPSIGPAQVIDQAQLARELRDQFDRDYPPTRRADDNLVLHALGLLAPGQDVATLQLELLSGQVIGFYDEQTRRMVVVSDSGVGPLARITYAHEYTHALQDAAFGLASLQTDVVGQDDRDLARLSLVEGDATQTMLLWAVDHLTPQELLGISLTPQPDTSGIPAWMLQQLELPYTAGLQFVSRLYQSGGWAAVDAVFRSPPNSTEQVLHPAAWEAREAPVKVAAPPLATALGSGWTESSADTLGEAMIAIWLQALGAAPGEAQTAAQGWGGDRLVAAAGPHGAMALAFRIAWDTPADAAEFAATYRGAAASLEMASTVVSLSDRETLVVQASSQAIIDRAVAGLG